MAALAFDPAARADMPGEQQVTSVPPSAPAEPPVVPPPLAAPVTEDRPAIPPRVTKPSARWRLGVGTSAGALGLASPGMVLSYGAFLDLERDAPGLSPSFRAGGMRAGGTASASGVDAELTWTLARLSLCPFRFDLASTVSVRPCAGLDVGSLAAHASGVEQARDRARPWVAPAAAARLSWSPARIVYLELEAGVALPVVRDDVVVDPSVNLYRASILVSSGQVGAGVRFP